MNQKVQAKLELIKNLSSEIFQRKAEIRNRRTLLLLKSSHIKEPSYSKLEGLVQENQRLKQQKSVLNSYQNRLTLDRIQRTDPKLFTLIQKCQVAESENLKLKKSLTRSKEEKDKATSEYFLITCRFLEIEKLKTRVKELEKDCHEKSGNVEKLSNALSSLKLRILKPNANANDLRNLQVLFKELVKEKNIYTEDINRLKFEYEAVCNCIQTFHTSPKKRCVSVDKLKDHILQQTERKSSLDNKIRSKEQYRNNVKCFLDRAYLKGRTKDSSFCETERKYLVKKVNITLDSSSNNLSTMKSVSKPSTPLSSSKRMDLNKSQLLYRKT